MDGSSGSNTSTRDFGTDSSLKRVRTSETSANDYVRGFTFGQSGSGSSASSSYVYSTVGGYGAPFTQVFLRPKTTTADMSYDAIPDSGTSAADGPAGCQERRLAGGVGGDRHRSGWHR